MPTFPGAVAMRRVRASLYHLLWAFPLATVVLLGGMVLATGAYGRSVNPGGWWPVIVVGAALSLAQAAVAIVVYRRLRRRWIERQRLAGRRRRLVRRELAQVRAQAEQLAVEDPMTGLFNQRHMKRQLAVEFERCRRYGQPLSCAMIDADFFKRVNDALGHPTGDEVIRQMAGVLRQQARQMDILGHYGGDEFLVLMPNTPLEAAGHLAERIRRFFAECGPRLTGQPLVTTCSIGIAAAGPDDPEKPEELLERADRAMYEAKRRGRNRVCLWERAAVREYSGEPTGDEGANGERAAPDKGPS